MARGNVRTLVVALLVGAASCGDDGGRPIDAAIDHDAEEIDAMVAPGTPVLRGGVFVGGAVEPDSGATVHLRGRFVWHGRIEGEAGGVRLTGWFE